MAESGVLTRPPAQADGGPAGADESAVFLRADGTELLGAYQDSGYQVPKYLVRRADGQVMQLPQLLYRVLESLDGRTVDEIADALTAELGQPLTSEQVAYLVTDRLDPVGVVALPTDAGPGSAAPSPERAPLVKSDPLLALRYRAGVVPATLVWRIAGVLRPLFERPVWVTLLAVFLAVDLAVLLSRPLVAQAADGAQSVVRQPVLVLVIMGLTMASAAFHECGHATACRYGGATPGSMGVGIYLIWPAFFSTVTDAYRLDRVGRLRTDLGGVYFNAIFMSGLGAVYLATGQSWLLLALMAMHVETAWQFLPSIRLDGYYILADLVGVPDLFAFVGPVLSRLVPGRKTHARILELRPWARRLILLWVAVVVPSLVGVLVVVLVALPVLLPPLWSGILAQVEVLGAAARAGEVLTTTLGVIQLGLLALPWLGGGLVLWMLLQFVVGKTAARLGGGAVPLRVRAAVRRAVSLLVLSGLGAVLMIRVTLVARSLPAGAEEGRLVADAVARLHGEAGSAAITGFDMVLREQLVGYARLTGAFGQHPTAVTAGRELALLATALLVVMAMALVATRRVRPLAVGLPLGALLLFNPALVVLASLGPGIVGAAWVAGGLFLLVGTGSRAARVAGGLALAVGVGTAPLLAVVLAAGAVVPPSCRPGARRSPARHAGPVARRRHGWRWFLLALILSVGWVLAAVSGGREGLPVDGSELTLLLLTAAVVMTAAVPAAELRPVLVSAGTALLLVLTASAGATQALPVLVVSVVLLAVLLTDRVVRRPVAERPHPLLRAIPVVPLSVLVVVGGLFLPARVPPPAHAALADWIAGPGVVSGTIAVPPATWADLVRDGVRPALLVRSGTAAEVGATWVVVGGVPAPATAAARFGTGESTLSVTARSPRDGVHGG